LMRFFMLFLLKQNKMVKVMNYCLDAKVHGSKMNTCACNP